MALDSQSLATPSYVPAGNFGGFLQMDQQPIREYQNTQGTSLSFAGGIGGAETFTLSADKPLNLKILGGKAKGIVKCIVQDWLTRQVGYIANNLTKMTVGVTLPDLSSLTE